MNELFPTIVYGLCLLTSAACAWLLGQSYRRTRMPLLFWSAVCFALLAANNFILVLDLVVYPSVDMRIARLVLALAAILALVWGFVWEPEDEPR